MICPVCKKNFIPDKYHPYATRCSAKCSNIFNRSIHNYQLERRHKVKKEIFELLGNKCVKCGYTGVALQVDHINGDGRKEITEYRIKQSSLAYWIHILAKIKAGSKDYQLLCANHNWEKYYGNI